MEFILTKSTANLKHSVRYEDEDNHNIYLKKSEATELGDPEKVKVSITAEK